MKWYLLSAAIGLSSFGFSQDSRNDTLIDLGFYVVEYSQEFKQPLIVDYDVLCPHDSTTRSECNLRWRSHKGVVTSKYEMHYKGKEGWNRGHMAPVNSLDCNCEMAMSTMNYLNCAIQDSVLNRTVWLELEKRERSKALGANLGVHVTIVVAFEGSKEMNGAKVPSGFYKTILSGKNSETYYFPNTPPRVMDLDYYRITGTE